VPSTTICSVKQLNSSNISIQRRIGDGLLEVILNQIIVDKARINGYLLTLIISKRKFKKWHGYL
jgi:hypothetical protein